MLAFVLSLFGARLVQLQGLDAPTYAAEAEQGRLRTVTLPAARGTITDRNGIALATTVAAVNITSDQTKVVDPAATAAVLAPVLQMDPTVLREKLTGDARFVYLAKAVTPGHLAQGQRAGPPGPRHRRACPASTPSRPASGSTRPGQVGANIVGFVGADGKGLGGIEYALDSTLAGRDGTATYELSAGGRRIPSGVDTERDAVPGTDVRLTIDRDIQYVAQKAIAKAVASSQAQSGTVIVYDPKTGDLLAVATAPSFDPNDPGAAPAEDRGDRPLTEAYEPGSTGKIITASALIQEGVITPTTPIIVPNRLYRAGKSFKDFEEHGVEHLTYAGTIAKSSNIGTIKAAERLGNLKRLYPYLKKFGVGEPTGLGLPGEQSGEIPKPGDWSATSGYTMTFGQGYSVNAVQMASVFATVANDGVRVSPRLVASTTGPNGAVHQTPASKRTRVISAADRPDRPADDGDGARRGRHRAAGARSPATGSVARPAPRSGSTRPAAATAATPCRSSGWLRSTTRAWSWRSPCRRPRSPSAAASRPARSSSRWRRSRSSRCGSRRPGPSRPGLKLTTH